MQRNREPLDLFDGMGAHDRERGGDRFVDCKAGGRGHPVWLDKSGPPIQPNFRIIVGNSEKDEPMGSPDSRVVTPPGGHGRGRNGNRLVDREHGDRSHPVWLDKSGPPNFRIIVENSENLDEPMGLPDSRVVTPPGGHDRGRTGKSLSEALIFSSTNI